MVHRQQQHVLVRRQPHQPASDQRTTLKIEWRGRFHSHQSLQLACRIRHAPEVVLHQGKACLRRSNLLHRQAVVTLIKYGPQRLVPRHDPVQRAHQRLSLKPPDQPQSTGYVIRRARSLET